MKSLIHTIEEKCEGCNKCIAKCPVHANTALLIDGANKINVDNERCINCGECIHVCDHEARYYTDDTEDFFNALARGEKITVLAAPAVRTNFTDYLNLFGFLKEKKVKQIYDVSFGADITTWAYLKVLEHGETNAIISQPCPVIVNYVECYQPVLIPYLAPIQSPAMCAAIYLKKYKNCTDKLAFLSPCIAKSSEFENKETFGYITYNVTFEKIREYLVKNGISLGNYLATNYDNTPCDLGFTFSRPGGLRENVEFYAGDDIWIKQIEGIHDVKAYFEQYDNRIAMRKSLPTLVDVLNCKNGCNLGTGASRTLQQDTIDDITNATKKHFMREQNKEESRELLAKTFDEELELDDFRRQYSDMSHTIEKANEDDIQKVFAELNKIVEEWQKHNCYACGYGNCRDFASAVSLGNNHIENCFYYTRIKLDRSRAEFDDLLDQLSALFTDMNKHLNRLESSSKGLNSIALQTQLISMNASIEAVHAGKDGLGFAVVADEMEKLSRQSSSIISQNQENEVDLELSIENIKKLVGDITDTMHNALK